MNEDKWFNVRVLNAGDIGSTSNPKLVEVVNSVLPPVKKTSIQCFGHIYNVQLNLNTAVTIDIPYDDTSLADLTPQIATMLEALIDAFHADKMADGTHYDYHAVFCCLVADNSNVIFKYTMSDVYKTSFGDHVHCTHDTSTFYKYS